MKYSLLDIFTDEHGLIDKSRSQNGTGMSSKNQVSIIYQICGIIYILIFILGDKVIADTTTKM